MSRTLEFRANFLMLAFVGAMFGCTPQDDGPRLIVFCGAGIRPPVAEIAGAFSQRHGIQVECDYAGSEVLLTRIKLTRAGDVYLPGDVSYIEQAQAAGLISRYESVCEFAPVILVHKGNPKQIKSLADLTRSGIALGLGDSEACAIGRTCWKLFQKNGISADQLAANVKYRSMTVNELGDQVKVGALDAVIVWDAVAAYFSDATDVVSIPREQNVISTVAIGLLRSSKETELANAFLDFAVSADGKAIFSKHHYSVSDVAPTLHGGNNAAD